jgi:hypothetical protein
VEEERVKSALEIAMERISAMPELTAEDMAAQKEKQYRPIGEAMAGRYLSGLLDDVELPAELDKYRPDQRDIIRRALVSNLCRAISLEGDPESAGKALKGMVGIEPGKGAFIEKTAKEFQTLLRDFEQEKREQSAEIDAAALRPLGISGTAVRCNPAENARWLEGLKRMQLSYEPRLEALRTALQRELSSQQG